MSISAPRAGSGAVSSAVPNNLRTYVSRDVDLIVPVLTSGNVLHTSFELLGTARSDVALHVDTTSDIGPDLVRHYETAVKTENFVIKVADEFERADRPRWDLPIPRARRKAPTQTKPPKPRTEPTMSTVGAEAAPE